MIHLGVGLSCLTATCSRHLLSTQRAPYVVVSAVLYTLVLCSLPRPRHQSTPYRAAQCRTADMTPGSSTGYAEHSDIVSHTVAGTTASQLADAVYAVRPFGAAWRGTAYMHGTNMLCYSSHHDPKYSTPCITVHSWQSSVDITQGSPCHAYSPPPLANQSLVITHRKLQC